MYGYFGCALLLHLSSVVFAASTVGDFPSNDLGFGYNADGTPIDDWRPRTFVDVGPQVPLVPAPPPLALFGGIMWRPPPAAEGQAVFVDTIPWDQTMTLPYQNFSDISFYQLNLFMKTYNQILTEAAAASNVPIADGPKIFMKQAFYTLAIWFPETMGILRLTDVEDIWTVEVLDDVIGDMAAQMNNQFVALYGTNGTADVRNVIEIADEAAYAHHQFNQASPNNRIVRSTFLHLIDAQLHAAKFFLGAEYNDEKASALESVFNFCNAMNLHYLDLYETGCLKREELGRYIVFNTTAIALENASS